MKIVCTVNHDTATVVRPMLASSTRAAPCAWCATASTSVTAARLTTQAVRSSTSVLARDGSSWVARSAVASADIGQTADQTSVQNTAPVTSQPIAGTYFQPPS